MADAPPTKPGRITKPLTAVLAAYLGAGTGVGLTVTAAAAASGQPLSTVAGIVRRLHGWFDVEWTSPPPPMRAVAIYHLTTYGTLHARELVSTHGHQPPGELIAPRHTRPPRENLETTNPCMG